MTTPAGDLEIRPFRDGDADAVAAIFAHYVTTTVVSFEAEPRSPDTWRGIVADLTAAGWPFLVATAPSAANPVIGFGYVAPWRTKPAYSRTVEDTVYLAPGATGRGYGRRLLAAVLDAAASAGAWQVIAVIADAGDPSSQRLHERLGFWTVGVLREVGFKHGRWVDVTLMQRALGGPA